MKYQMGDLQDPLKSEINAANALPSGKLKPKPKYGRDSLDVKIWDKLDCTPYGRFDRLIVPDLSKPNPYSSRVNFDHYKVATGRADLDREFPRGKRVDFPGAGRDLRTSVQMAAHLEKSWQG